MVVSLESQNVKIRKSYYTRKKVFKPDISFISDNIAQFNLNANMITYILGLFMFSLFFYKCGDFFIFHKNTVHDISRITLPAHDPDIVTRDNIDKYKGNRRSDLFTEYKFSRGDTISSISIKNSISRDSLLHVNQIDNLKKLHPGMILKIPEIDGYIHNVTSRDSLESLSDNYNVPVKDIFRINALKSETLVVGSSIFIPYLNASEWGWKSNIDKYFVYPVKGQIIKRFGQYVNEITGLAENYEGIDFKAIEDKSIYASKSGYVSRVGYNPNYGNYIFIDHHGGMRTLYAHLKEVRVSNREKVDQGHILGMIGDSGFAKSEKLFFCILDGDTTVDPEKYLK